MAKRKFKSADYIEAVKAYIIKKYGEVPTEWEAIILMLGDNLELYKDIVDTIKQTGIYDKSTGKKNELLSTLKDLQASVMKQIQHIGLSPYAVSKIKIGEDDSSDDYISMLTGDDDNK